MDQRNENITFLGHPMDKGMGLKYSLDTLWIKGMGIFRPLEFGMLNIYAK